MATGTITRWNKERGYGFVRPAAGGKDVFVHVNDLSAPLQQALREGNLEGLVIEFEVVESQKGPAAKNVRPKNQTLPDPIATVPHIAFGTMPAYTWRAGGLEAGITVSKTALGSYVNLGQPGRGRKLTQVPLVGFSTNRLSEVAVADLGQGYGLTQSDRREAGAFLVVVDPEWVYTLRARPEIDTWKGSPTIVASGCGAQGDAGNLYSWPVPLMILREGDVLFVCPEGGGYKVQTYALFVRDGKLATQEWWSWKIDDLKRNPDFYVAKGTAPYQQVPSDWVGRVVSMQVLGRNQKGLPEVDAEVTGVVLKTKPLTLNLGWDGSAYYEYEVPSRAVWIQLETDKVVVPSGPDMTQDFMARFKASWD